MTAREKKLAVAVGVIIALWLGNWVWQKFSTWEQSATARQTSAESDLQTALFEHKKALVAVKQLRAWRESRCRQTSPWPSRSTAPGSSNNCRQPI